MAEPLFSIVTISHNQAEFLARTIESVLSQKNARVQYIICDPGSSDRSREIIDSYGGAIAERVYERDSGPSDGLNRGFTRATGDIYGYLNSDDTFLPGALAWVGRYFRENPEVDVLTGHALVTDRHDKVLRRVWSEPYRRRAVAYGVAAQFQPSTFVRAGAFRRTPGFNPDNRSSWDGELLMELFLSGARIRVVDAFLSTYRLHAASLTNTGAEQADARRFERERFARLMGRERRRRDAAIEAAFRLWKRVRHPRIVLEGHLRGPLHLRGAE